MDAAHRNAILACGRCGQPEDAHKTSTSTDAGDLDLFAALGGPCTQFVVSDAAVIYTKHLAITDNRAPRRIGRKLGKRSPLCERCGHRGHTKKDCPI
jgi:hypothetical protein